MALARLIRDGEAQRYLAEVCPQAGFALCAHQDGLKAGWDGGNDFLWAHGSPFEAIGGWPAWRAVGAEARAILRGALLAHPWYNLEAALRAWGQQLLTFGTGSGLGADIWATIPLRERIQARFPADYPALLSARQYLTHLHLRPLSLFHQTVLAAFMLAGLWQLARGWRLSTPAAALLFLVTIGAVVNGGITAIFSNPDDRYQARLVWLFIPAVFFLWVQSGRLRGGREKSNGHLGSLC